MNVITLNIPPHERCTNCGKCCGPVVITNDEYAAIRKFIAQNRGVLGVMQGDHEICECIFRDNEHKRCAIYPVRPLTCRIFGVSDSPFLQCPNGNSARINFGQTYTDGEVAGVQNLLDWSID